MLYIEICRINEKKFVQITDKHAVKKHNLQTFYEKWQDYYESGASGGDAYETNLSIPQKRGLFS